MKLSAFLVFVGSALAFEVMLEVKGSSKACISDRFSAGHPISVKATLVEGVESDGLTFLLLMEDDTRAQIGNSQFDQTSPSSTLTYNNDQDQLIYVCVDNYVSARIYVNLNIKSEQDFASMDLAPSRADFEILEKTLGNVDKSVLESFSYVQGLDHFSTRIISESSSFESKVIVFSTLAIGVMLVIGYLQFYCLKNELRKKKIF